MKIIFLFLFFASIDSNIYGQSVPADSVVMNELLKMNFKKFEKKSTVGEFLRHLPWTYKRYVYGEEPMGVLHSVMFSLTDNISIDVYVKKYKYLQPFDRKRKWGINLFLRETIDKIEVWNIGTCIKGCR